jgi:putative membrane protein insertion efficiency factor
MSVLARSRGASGGVGKIAVRAIVSLIQLYRHMVSPLRPATCRFVPTCSQYAVDALTQYGLIRGSWLALVRLAKCGPWHRGGWDPIPERCEHRAAAGGAASAAAVKQRERDTFV